MSESFTSPQHPVLIFFDGQCVFCDHWVLRLMQADGERFRLRYGPKQGSTFARVATQFPSIANVDSLVALVRDSHGEDHPLIRSRAVAEIISELPGLSFVLLRTLLRMTPTPLADIGYRIFSKIRYTLFGKKDSCRIPTPEERSRFVD